jgi:hypothetical protein
MLTSRERILVTKQTCSEQNALFGITYIFSPTESDRCRNITGLGFAIQPSLNHAERLPQVQIFMIAISNGSRS